MSRVAEVGEWKKPLEAFMCPPPPFEPDPCNCGYDGPWDRRPTYELKPITGKPKSAHEAQRKQAGGWLITNGFDERCPECGDIERFDFDANLLETFSESAKIISLNPNK